MKGERVDEEFADIYTYIYTYGRRPSTSKSGGEEIFHRPARSGPGWKKGGNPVAAWHRVGDETGTRGTGKGGIKGQEINASISSNTVEHSSALWRRVCTPHTFFLLFEKLLCVEPFIQLNRWDRESAGSLRVRVPRLGRIFPTCHFAARQVAGVENAPADTKILAILNLLPRPRSISRFRTDERRRFLSSPGERIRPLRCVAIAGYLDGNGIIALYGINDIHVCTRNYRTRHLHHRGFTHYIRYNMVKTIFSSGKVF